MNSWWEEAKQSAARGLLPGIMLIVLTVFLGVVMFKIMWTDTSIPVSSSTLETTASSNEHLLQLVQWSLSTVIGLGLAVIGINWFQSSRDRNELKELESNLRSTIKEIEDRYSELETSSLDLEARLIRFEIQRSITEQGFFRFGSVAFCIMEFERAASDSLRKRICLEEAIRYAKMNKINTDGDHSSLLNRHNEIKEYDRAMGGEVSTILANDMIEAQKLPKDERPLYAGGTTRT